jgi:hypothetical protein
VFLSADGCPASRLPSPPGAWTPRTRRSQRRELAARGDCRPPVGGEVDGDVSDDGQVIPGLDPAVDRRVDEPQRDHAEVDEILDVDAREALSDHPVDRQLERRVLS